MRVHDLLTTSACTLPTAERPLRLAEFDTLFAEHLTGSTWIDDRLRLELTGGDGLRDRVADLAARESECCSFFDFSLSGAGDTIVLEVGAPPERHDILAGLAEIARGADR